VTSYGGATFDWTAQGELLGKHLGGSTTTYASDSLGRLQSVTLPTGHVVSYVYDGSNRRVGKKIDGVLQQGFLYHDAIKPVVELDGSGTVVSRFVYGTNPITPDYVVKGGSTYKIFSDQIGSPRVVVDVSSGSVVERIDYDERGNTLKDTNAGFIPFGFAGGIVDRDTGLIRFGVRDYDPSAGRWTRKEPLGFNVTTNFYLYADGDPINKIDLDGTCAAPVEAFFVAYTFNAAGQVLNSPDGSYDVCEALEAGVEAALTTVALGGVCFAPATPVETADGEKPIADIKVGDEVWSRDETTGERELRPVLQKYVTPEQSLLDLDVVAGAKDEVIRATPTHRFWVDGKGWTPAEDLRAGDTFDLYAGKHAVFAGAEKEREKATVYNLEVDGTHTYFVGHVGVWVHNGCGSGPVRQGAAGVAQAEADLEAAGGKVLGREITIDAGSVRTRADLYVQFPNGTTGFLEVKTGPSAGLTTNQSIAYPVISSQGGVPQGANAAAAQLTPGVPIAATPVWTVYYPWPLQ
jgi:RHS repeat-associated protein